MLSEVIARARRRLLWNALAFHFAVALNVGLAVLALLLFLGIDLLDWRWLIVMPATCLLAGVVIARVRLLQAYPTAQVVDRRLDLADTLSTAFFFAHPHPPRRCDEEAQRAQHEAALRVAAGVDLRRAIPIRMPRIIYAAALPAIVAAGLFDIRYRFDPALNLHPPMTAILQQLLRDSRNELAKREDPLEQPEAPDPPESEEGKKHQAGADGKDAQANTPGPSNTNTAGAESTNQQASAKADTFAEEQQQPGEGEQQMSEGGKQGTEQNSPAGRKGDGRDQKQQTAGEQAEASSDGGSSVVSRLKNSLSNLLSALKPSSGSAGKPQSAKSQDGRQDRSNRKQSDQSSESANGQPAGEAPQQPGGAQSAGEGQSAKAQGDKQMGTGAGREEGSKDINEAEQLDAMGKLRVLLGKRANSLTGEFTAQAPPGPQRLETNYTKRSALHTDVHAKAQRDEVPLAFQEYVQRYFEMVQKANPSTARPQRAVAASLRRSQSVR